MQAGGGMREHMPSAAAEERGKVIFYGPEEDSFTEGAKEVGVSVCKFKEALTAVYAEAVASDVGSSMKDTELIKRLLDKLEVDAPSERRTEEAIRRALYAAAVTTVLCYKDRNGKVVCQEGLDVQPREDSQNNQDACEGQCWSPWSPDVVESDEPEVVGVEQQASDAEARGEEARGEEARGEEARGEEARAEEACVMAEAGVDEAVVAARDGQEGVIVGVGVGDDAVEDEYTLLHNISATGDAMNALYKAERWDSSCLHDEEFSEVLSKMNGDAFTVKRNVQQLRRLENQERYLRREVAAKHMTLRPVMIEILSGYKKRPEQIIETQKMEKEMADIERQLTEGKKDGERLAKEMESFREGKKRAMAALDYTQKWAKIQKCIEDCKQQYPDQKEETLEAIVENDGTKMKELKVALEKTRSAYDAIKEEWKSLDEKNRERKKDVEKFKALVGEWRDKWHEWNDLKTHMVIPAFSLAGSSV